MHASRLVLQNKKSPENPFRKTFGGYIGIRYQEIRELLFFVLVYLGSLDYFLRYLVYAYIFRNLIAVFYSPYH